MANITLARAQAVVSGAIAYARADQFVIPMAVIVLDARAAPKIYAVECGSALQRRDFAPGKAYGALAMSIGMTTRTDDYDAIDSAAQLYIDGFNENSVSKLREAFYEDAWIFYIDAEGALHKNLISESFEKWATLPGSGVVGRFISVTQVCDAAAVQLSFDCAADKTGGWIDFHNLLRINGVWKITNKTASHSIKLPRIVADSGSRRLLRRVENGGQDAGRSARTINHGSYRSGKP